MLPNCSHLLTDFRTVFVFALGPILPMFVILFDFNGNFNGKMAKIHFLAIKSSRSVLQPSRSLLTRWPGGQMAINGQICYTDVGQQ